MSFGFCIKTPAGRFLRKASGGKHPTAASMTCGMRYLHESDAIGYANQMAERNAGVWEVWCTEDGRLVHSVQRNEALQPRKAFP